MDNPAAKNKKLFIIIAAVVGALALSAVVCCGGAFFFGFRAIDEIEKTYYPDCEHVATSDECSACCRKHGHSSSATGNMINEKGKNCGCF